jgi:DNA-binding IclR family transcriptional regulator
MTKTKAKPSPYRVQVIDRVLGVLEILASDESALTLVELCKRLELPKSTVLRLLMVLESHRFVEKDAHSGAYRLGLKLFELGSKAVARLDLDERAKPYLERLVFATGETAYCCVLHDGQALAVARVESSRAVRAPSTVGWRAPVHCTAVGKALLAFLPEAEFNTLFKQRKLHAYTPNTITTLTQLRNELHAIRACGYAIDNEEMEEGLKCLAAPVRGNAGKLVAAIGILGPSFRLPEEKISQLAAAVMREANDFSIELGYRGDRHASRRRVWSSVSNGS